jgi:hypothetical protein
MVDDWRLLHGTLRGGNKESPAANMNGAIVSFTANVWKLPLILSSLLLQMQILHEKGKESPDTVINHHST